MIEANKRYIAWSDHYHQFGGNTPITWFGHSKAKLDKFFPTWKELQGQPIKAIKVARYGSQGDVVWQVLSLRHNFKFGLNSLLIKPVESFSDEMDCVCDSRKLFNFGCDCGGI